MPEKLEAVAAQEEESPEEEEEEDDEEEKKEQEEEKEDEEIDEKQIEGELSELRKLVTWIHPEGKQ